MEDSDLLATSLGLLEDTCNYLGINENYYRYLSKPMRVVITSCPVRMDDGHLRIFTGYRVLHSNILGPGKGGLRICPDTTLDDLKALAMLMTWKSALIGLPLGGSKGNISADPRKLSKKEMERLIRRYTVSIINIIGPEQDIPSPDLNTNEETMAIMMDTYSMGMGKTVPGVVTGKPIELGGIYGRDKAVGWGLAYIMRYYARRTGEELRDKKVIIQGIGHVGRNFARTAREFGAKIIGISDSSVGLYNPDGLDINDVIDYKEKNGSLKDYPRAENMDNNELMKIECDALAPCATQCQITKEAAENLNCRMVIEGANAPMTLEADRVLTERDIVVIPDIIANSGGLIVSYFEWVQDLSQLRWKADRVARELENIITNAFEEVYRVRHEEGVSYRKAAYIISLKRVVKALEYRGIYP